MAEKPIVVTAKNRKILKILTGEDRLDIAILAVIKQLIEYRMKAAQARINAFEQKYGMPFTDFTKACKTEKIENSHLYEVEKDNWEWDTAIVEMEDLTEYERVIKAGIP